MTMDNMKGETNSENIIACLKRCLKCIIFEIMPKSVLDIFSEL